MEHGEALLASASPSFEELKLPSKRRSCDLVNTASPCVKKALFHLRNLQDILRSGDVIKQPLRDDIISLQSILHSDLKSDERSAVTRKQLRFLSPAPVTPSGEFGSVFSDGGLVIQGTGGKIPPKANDVAKLKIISEVKEQEMYKSVVYVQQPFDLGPDDIFKQVTELILRLEEDRYQAERALERERARLGKLNQKISGMTQRRLMQLPAAVQREHEACARDIVELQWHVADTMRQLARSKDQVKSARTLNQTLREDIEFVRQHCPLVEEKLGIEKAAMKKIKEQRKETSEELEQRQIDLNRAEIRYQEQVESADQERKNNDDDLDHIQRQIVRLDNEMVRLEAMRDAYAKKREQGEKKLEEQDLELKELQKRVEEAREEEQTEMIKINELKDEVKQVEFETGELTKQKNDLEDEIESVRQDMEQRVSALDNKYMSGLRELRQIEDENRDLQFDIEDMEKEIQVNEKATVKAEREIARFVKEQNRCESELKVVTDQCAQIKILNQELKSQLEQEEMQTQKVEETLKAQAEELRKQVNEEMRQRTALEAKRQLNTKALHKGKIDNAQKKQKVQRALNESEIAAARVQQEVDSLTAQYEKSLEVVQKLEKELAVVEKEHEKVEKELTEEKEELVPIETELQTQQLKLKEEVKEMEFEQKQMVVKMDEMKVSRAAMNKRITVTQANIDRLSEELAELNLQLDCSETMNESLKKQCAEAKKRLEEREKIHAEMMASRVAVREELQRSVQQAMLDNTDSAQKYRELQSKHIDLKNRLMTLYDNKLALEVSIKDYKQLVILQEKLNSALKQYYHKRGEYNKQGLEHFHQRSKENTEMMMRVQKGLEIAIDNISLFLRSQIDGSAVLKVHQAAFETLRGS